MKCTDGSLTFLASVIWDCVEIQLATQFTEKSDRFRRKIHSPGAVAVFEITNYFQENFGFCSLVLFESRQNRHALHQ